MPENADTAAVTLGTRGAVRPVQPQISVSTVLVDSIAADTARAIPVFATGHYRDSVAVDVLNDSLAAHVVLSTYISGTRSGLEPAAHNDFPAGGSVLTAILAATMLLAAIGSRGIVLNMRRFFASLAGRSSSADVPPGSLTPAAMLLALVFVVFGGVTLYLGAGVPVLPSLRGALTAIAVLGAYYVFQISVFSLVGYSFTGAEGRRRWVDSFMGSQALAGLLLMPVGLLMVCMPQWHVFLTFFAAIIYISVRLIFISKGFRIFYRGFRSLLYFFLYLCTLEIIPAMAVLGIVRRLVAYLPVAP